MSAPVKRVFNRAVKLYMEASTGAEVKVRPLLLNIYCRYVLNCAFSNCPSPFLHLPLIINNTLMTFILSATGPEAREVGGGCYGSLAPRLQVSSTILLQFVLG